MGASDIQTQYSSVAQDEEATHVPRRYHKVRKSLKFAVIALLLLTVVLLGCLVLQDRKHASIEPETEPTTPKLAKHRALSCSPQANETDSCFVENPTGLLLLAQMYNPKLSVENWLIHGLWPNYCNGSYPTSCDPEREVDDVPKILRQYHRNFLVNAMQLNWLNDPEITQTNGTARELWAHEWNKHGTCLSTLQPRCYHTYSPQQEVVDYFRRVITLYTALPTFQLLQKCGIVPSTETTYGLADVQGCLTNATKGNYTPLVRCNEGGELNEVWYHFFMKGSLASLGWGVPVATDAVGESNCPKVGIKYMPSP